VTNRDLRRTWKTLAGQAGISKEIRDRLQNHTLQDVSSKSYDRWSYMPEKRAAMEKWDAFVRSLLAKKYDVRDVA
jgi:integrase